MKNKQLYIIVGVITLLIFLYSISETSLFWSVPQELVGSWSGKQKVTVRFENTNGYSFIAAPDSVLLNLTIAENGTVSGKLGNAVFVGCAVHKNRGWVGRIINIATDFSIRGSLKSSIFPSDTIPEMKIMMPFSNDSNILHGSIFQKVGLIDVYPMVGFKLRK